MLDTTRSTDARLRPLGSYFRVNHRDLVAMHAALTEVGILYATAQVHSGWQHVKADGIIRQTDEIIGGHAFAVVAYDQSGFWIQNSWADGWGDGGFGKISYDDWLSNGTDVWVARLGVPVELSQRSSIAILQAAGSISSPNERFHELRPHIISVGNNGQFRDSGTYATNDKLLASIMQNDVAGTLKGWTKKRILLYAHGGLVPEDAAIQRVSEYRTTLLENEIYPLAFVWKTDYWTTVSNLLRDAQLRQRPEGVLDSLKDFMLDRADDALEPLARALTGRAVWSEMKENAVRATTSRSGAARKTALELLKLTADPELAGMEIHVAGHSAGSIFLGPLVKYLASPAGAGRNGSTGLGLPIESCTLWAPACTVDFFVANYAPVLQNITRMSLFTLTDGAERDDDCAGIYHKSLLYLVSNAFEETPHVPLLSAGEPIVGMEKWIRDRQAKDAEFRALFRGARGIDWVLAPNTEPPASGRRSTATHHGDFDDDPATVQSTLELILGKVATKTANLAYAPTHTDASHREQRRSIAAMRA